MNWIKIDNDSYGTILGSWIVCAVLIWLTAHFIHNLWISIPVSAIFVIFMVFITYFFRVPNRTAPELENDRLVTSVADGKVVIVEKVFEKESGMVNITSRLLLPDEVVTDVAFQRLYHNAASPLQAFA